MPKRSRPGERAGEPEERGRRLRIAHVVTYVSSDGAFGGPVAVAMGQATELARRGHRVDLYAAWDGVTRPAVAPCVRLRLFRVRRPGTGLSSIFSPRLLIALLRSSRRYDAVHVHVTRDLVCLGALAVTPRKRLVLQPHGQVRPDGRLRARVVDRALVVRALRGARGVFTLTSAEDTDLRGVAGESVPTVRIHNGLVVPEGVSSERSGPLRVLFLARLHPRKQVLVFAEAARRARDAGLTDVEFRVVGPDGGDLPELLAFIERHDLASTLTYAGAVSQEDAAAELAGAHVFVLPSVAEVYPMTVLQALAAGTAVVVTEQSGLSRSLRDAGAALVVDPAPGPVLDAIRALVADEGLRRAVADRGTAFAREQLSIGAVVDRLETVYR